MFDLKAPLNKNTKIGKLKVTYDNNEYFYDLIVKDDIKKANIFNIIFTTFKDIISGFKLLG